MANDFSFELGFFTAAEHFGKCFAEFGYDGFYAKLDELCASQDESVAKVDMCFFRLGLRSLDQSVLKATCDELGKLYGKIEMSEAEYKEAESAKKNCEALWIVCAKKFKDELSNWYSWEMEERKASFGDGTWGDFIRNNDMDFIKHLPFSDYLFESFSGFKKGENSFNDRWVRLQGFLDCAYLHEDLPEKISALDLLGLFNDFKSASLVCEKSLVDFDGKHSARKNACGDFNLKIKDFSAILAGMPQSGKMACYRIHAGIQQKKSDNFLKSWS